MCIRVLHAMYEAGLEPNVSLKLTQFGIDFSPEACEANVSALVQSAAAVGGFVRIDMEGSAYTERTLELVRRIHAQHGACGTVIQACLHRSAHDVSELVRQGIRVRLVKGAYLEPPEIAFPEKADVDHHYIGLAHQLLGATQTQLPVIIRRLRLMMNGSLIGWNGFAMNNHIGRDCFEFQMCCMVFGGICRSGWWRMVIGCGFMCRLGRHGFRAFARGLAERPANLLFLARNLLHH